MLIDFILAMIINIEIHKDRVTKGALSWSENMCWLKGCIGLARNGILIRVIIENTKIMWY